MFFNASGLLQVFWLIIVCMYLLFAVIVAHCVWVRRTSQAPCLLRRTGIERGLAMTVVAITPVVSFYVWEIVTWYKNRMRKPLTSVVLPLTVSAALAMAIAAVNATRNEMRYVEKYRSWGHAIEGFVAQFEALMAAFILLLMIARVFTPDWRKAYRWLVIAFVIVITPALI